MRQKRIYDDQLIVITGAAGFIGSGVVRYLNDRGMTNLLLVDDFKHTDKWKNLVGKKFVDMVSRYDIFDWLEGREDEVEAFVHLGACSSTLETDGDYLMDNNYRFSVNLAEYALRNDHRFIYASSAATYGDGKLGFTDAHDTLYDLSPLNIYGYSKHLFDLWLMQENVLNKVVGLKYFNVFGPNEYHKGEMASMIYKMASIARSGKPIQLFKSNDPENFNDGEQVRDFIYVKDAVKMTCALLEDAFKDVSGIFNIGSGVTTSWNQLANSLFNALGKEANIQYVDMPKEYIKQYQNYTKAEMMKFFKIHADQESLVQITPIEDAVQEYVQKYLLRNARW